MRYCLEFVSQWVSFLVMDYTSIEACERDCETRYGVRGLTFTRDQFGILTANIYADDKITLNLYEVDIAHAS